jgi:hypothetical protein
MQQQQCEQRPLPRARHDKRSTLGAHLDRSEDPEVHRPSFSPPAADGNHCHRGANALQPPRRTIRS